MLKPRRCNKCKEHKIQVYSISWFDENKICRLCDICDASWVLSKAYGIYCIYGNERDSNLGMMDKVLDDWCEGRLD
jgi:hypothetical protein